MNRKHTHAMGYVIPILLTGLLLTCGLSLPDAGHESSSAMAAATSISQALLRDFVLPTPLFASNSAWTQTATTAEVLPESDEQILVTYGVLRGDTTSLYPPGPQPGPSWT